MLHVVPRIKHYRNHSVAATQKYLALRGYRISRPSVRRYSDLIDTPRIRTKGKSSNKYERVYSSTDLQRLEIVTILKLLGFTNKEVLVWLSNPNHKQVEARVLEFTETQGRARQLLAQLSSLRSAQTWGATTN